MNGGSKAVSAFVILILFGVASYWLYHSAFHPLRQIRQAGDWEKVPCTIVSSELKAHRSRSKRGKPTYSIAISYQYSFRGQRYDSNRYSFFTRPSSDTDWKYSVILQYPPGATMSCFVNPRAPNEAVLERGVTKAIWWGLISLPFLAIGLYVAWAWMVKAKEPMDDSNTPAA
jgi:hypothetical protein